MESFIEILSKPWPWYVAGPLIGLMIPTLLVLLNKQLGVSSSLRHVCAACIPLKSDFFDYDWKKESWNLFFVGGIALGALLILMFFPNPEPVDIAESTAIKLQGLGITDRSGLMPSQVFSWEHLSSPVTFIMVIIGGFFVGFGTRYAGGCTSGHAIMGLSQLSLGSLVATIGFFIGGLIMSWFILPQILSML